MMKPWFLICLFCLGACNGGGDTVKSDAIRDRFLGIYQVTHHTSFQGNAANLQACDEEGDDIGLNDPPFFAFVADDFIPGSYAVQLQTCASPAPADCVDKGSSFEPQDAETLFHSSFNTQTAGDGNTCALYHSKELATLQSENPNTVRIELRSWYATKDVPEDACELSFAEELPDTSDCIEVEVFEGTAVSP